MNDFISLEKKSVRELSCRLCLCNDVVKLKPLSTELKRKLKKLFDIQVRADDNLPKAICHECLQQVGFIHLYSVKVEKTQQFLEFYKSKTEENKKESLKESKGHPLIASFSPEEKSPRAPTPELQEEGDTNINKHKISTTEQQEVNTNNKRVKATTPELQQGDANDHKSVNVKASEKKTVLKKNPDKYMESMPLEEFAKMEKLDKTLLNTRKKLTVDSIGEKKKSPGLLDNTAESPDPIVLIDGKPAKQGAALDKQITLFYKMECCICHENGFHFRSLMKHYKERHGVPGYVTCCDKKFHYFYPKKIIEHMAYHLQPNIFMCNSCHHNFETSQELLEHQINGGRSEGKILCPRCHERYPTYRELGCHLISHRDGRMQCDYCGKALKHNHRKKTINKMEDIIVCSQCVRLLRGIEKQDKELKEKMKSKINDTILKNSKFASMDSCDEDASTD